MPTYEPGAVVRVPFPYANRPTRQFRPALVLAVPATGAGPALLWVAMITSATHRRWAGDFAIADLAAAGLPAPSMVRASKLATMEAGAAEPLGVLDADALADVRSWAVAMLTGVGE